MRISNCPYRREAWTDSWSITSPLPVVGLQNNEVSKAHSYMDTSIGRPILSIPRRLS